ncbi:MAG: hypothetical protein KDD27_24380 [Saprospiraceae bacterium]|nr:hypothetical protein [Saprospiraceae bacterium]
MVIIKAVDLGKLTFFVIESQRFLPGDFPLAHPMSIEKRFVGSRLSLTWQVVPAADFAHPAKALAICRCRPAVGRGLLKKGRFPFENIGTKQYKG